MKRLIVLFVLVLIGSHLRAENRVGVGYYAIQHPKWPCAQSMAVFRGVEVPRMSFLWNTFGVDLNCVKTFLRASNAELEVHLINEVCMKWGRCGKYEFGGGMRADEFNNKLKSNDVRFFKMLREYFSKPAVFLRNNLKPTQKCFISPGLESNLDRQAATVLLKEAKVFFPQCKMVWNPTGASSVGNLANMDVFEKHGAKAKLSPVCISNLDGEDMYEVDIPAYIDRQSKCLSAHLWTGKFNLISHGPFIDPRLRKGIPTSQEFDFVRKYLLADVDTPMASEDQKIDAQGIQGCRKVFDKSDGAGGFLYKPKSDTQGGLVLLFPSRYSIFSKVDMFNHLGKVGSLKYSGLGNPDSLGKRQHWRYQVPGYKLSKQLLFKTNTQDCWLIKNSNERFD